MAVLMGGRDGRQLRGRGAGARPRQVAGSPRATRRLGSVRGFADAVIGPFVEFFRAYGWLALLMLAMISLYRLPEFVMGPMANPFYHDLGLSKDAVGAVRASIGLVAVAAGHRRGRLQRGALRLFPDADRRRRSCKSVVIATFAMLGLHRAGRARVRRRHGGRQLRRRLRRRRARHVHVEPDQPRLHGDAVCASELGVHLRRQVREGVLRRDGRIGWRAGRTLLEGYALFFIGAGLLGIPALLLCLALARVQRGDAKTG